MTNDPFVVRVQQDLTGSACTFSFDLVPTSGVGKIRLFELRIRLMNLIDWPWQFMYLRGVSMTEIGIIKSPVTEVIEGRIVLDIEGRCWTDEIALDNRTYRAHVMDVLERVFRSAGIPRSVEITFVERQPFVEHEVLEDVVA